jgi:hypothetical protein
MNNNKQVKAEKEILSKVKDSGNNNKPISNFTATDNNYVEQI